MKYIKKIGWVVLLCIGLFLYASSSISRSLYSTKADANVEYETIGLPNQDMTIQQQFNVSNGVVKQVVVKTRPYTLEQPTQVNWVLQDTKGIVLASGVETLIKQAPYQDTIIIALPELVLHTTETYQLTFSGRIGQLFMKTFSGENNKGIVINGVSESKALTAKLVYGGFHKETFIVLVGLIIYIVLFMKGMTTLFK